MKTRGFSLIELLVAMAIFSVMALGLHQVWRNVSQTKSTTDLHREQLISLNKTLTYLERDLWQIVGRRVRDSYGDPVAPLMVGGTDYVLALTRTGWRHPGFRVRSHLQSVA
ncbi:MAG: type II secretion system minor pseudopilin GspJ, partial [Gammaproteobacteria bacterium]|nr:type II secretion system minor pseudopilin GspJ [Gammaproteobacteria bacterium]